MCLYPKFIKNKKYDPTTEKNKRLGIVPKMTDPRTKYVPVGCQNCMECRQQKARAWQIRLLEDIKTNKNGKFITLTFSNESIKKIVKDIQEYNTTKGTQTPNGYALDNQIATWATRHFLERYRKLYRKQLRHWLVTELGHNGTENIHLHGIIWTDATITRTTGRGKKKTTTTCTGIEAIEKTWQYGWIWKGKKINDRIINYVNEQTVNYIIKYVNKTDEIHTQYKSKVLTTPGIGRNYTNTFNSQRNKFNGTKTEETYRTRTGHKVTLPIYWRNKIYSEKQREQLWLNKLDKEERWVQKERADISKNYNAYDALLKWYQKINKQLGYGDDKENQDIKKYEEDRRNIMLATRIQNASPAGQVKHEYRLNMYNTIQQN